MRNSAVQSHLRFPLTRLLGSGGHVRVLRALTAYGAPLGVAQVAADTGLTARGVRLVLDSLASQGIVGVMGQPRTQLYTIDARHPLASALKALFDAEQTRWESVQQVLRDGIALLKDVRSAWMYGSAARGEDDPRSDVDVALVLDGDGPDVTDGVRDAVRALGDSLRIDLSVVVLSPADVARLPQDDPWWAGLVRDARILKGIGPRQEALRCARSVQPA